MAKSPVKKHTLLRSDPESLIQIGHGLGAVGESDCAKIVGMFKEKICTPAVTKIYFTSSTHFPGPLSPTDVLEAINTNIDPFNQDVPGATDVYQTAGLKNGQFQLPLLVMGIGIHGFAPQQSYAQRINAILASAFTTTTAPSFSPDAFTLKDIAAAWAPSQAPLCPGSFEYGDWINKGFHWFGLGFNLLWTMGNQVTLINDLMRHTLHMPQNPMDGTGGLSQTTGWSAINASNAYYQSLASALLMLPIDTLRQGSVTAAGNGRFAPSNDTQYVDQLWGGGTVRNLRKNPEVRMLDNPYILPAGIDVGIQFQSNSQDYLQATQSAWGTSPSGQTAIPFQEPAFANYAATGTSAYNEATIDGVTSAQTNPSVRVKFKGGLWQYDVVLAAWEITPQIMHYLHAHPEVAGQLQSECGIRCPG